MLNVAYHYMDLVPKGRDEEGLPYPMALSLGGVRTGVYYLPFAEEDHGPNQVGAFANVLPQGTAMNMGRQMSIGFVTQVISAFRGC